MQQYITMGSALSNLFSTYGIDILKDGNRLCAILGDTAPGLEKECKIIRRAKDEGVFPLLWEAFSGDAAKKASILSQIEYRLKSEGGFSDDWCQALITSFSKAFGWDEGNDSTDKSDTNCDDFELSTLDIDDTIDCLDADLLFTLGNRFYNGDGVDQDYDKAFSHYQRAALQHHAWAEYCLGFCYCFGKGVEQNYERALYWYRSAAEQGISWAENQLGDCYYHGRGVIQNYEIAASWYTRAAEKGDPTAQMSLGSLYEFGLGVKKSEDKAFELFKKAAEQGNPEAQARLGSGTTR